MRTAMSKRVQLLVIGLLCFVGGWFVAQQMPFVHAQAVKAPAWQYGLKMKVRKADEDDFTKDTKKIGIEVFKDENTGNLVYISESGSIAVVPAK